VGWGKGNINSGGAFCFAKYALQIRRKKSRSKRGRGGRGVWGEFRLARAEAKPRHPTRSEQTDKEKFCFPFKGKNRARANRKSQTKLFFVGASEASGGGMERQPFRSKKVRTSFSNCDQKYWE